MTDQTTEPLTAQEARLASRLHRWSDRGVVAIDATAIAMGAATAAQAGPTRWAGLAWPRIGSRRMSFGLAVLLLLTAGLALGAAVLLRTPNPSDAYRAVVTRQVGSGLDVVIADANGNERVLRHLTPESLGLDPRYTIAHARAGQRLSQPGWLELKADGSGAGPNRTRAMGSRGPCRSRAIPSRAPIVQPSSEFTTGEWGPDGRYALFCSASTEPPNCGQSRGMQAQKYLGAVVVLDPDRGATPEIIVPAVQTISTINAPYVPTSGDRLDIFWTADGSGFLAHDGEWGVTPLDGRPFVPGVPKILSRSWDPTRPDLSTWLGAALDPATPVGLETPSDRTAAWWLLDDPDHSFPRAQLARLTGPDTVESVRTFDLPAGPAVGFVLSADDTFVAIDVSDGDQPRFVLAPMGNRTQTLPTGPAIDGWLVESGASGRG